MGLVEKIKCDVCYEESSENLFLINYSIEVLKSFHNSPKDPNIHLKKCLNCGHCFPSHQLPKDFLAEYYKNDDSEYYKNVPCSSHHQTNLNKKLFQIITLHKNPKKVLEIGCGYGHFLSLFLKAEWDCTGIEPSSTAANFAIKNYGLKVINRLFDPNLFVNEKFEMILLIDVIEHLSNPNEFLKGIKNLMPKNGFLAILTGNVARGYPKIVKGNWGYFSSLEHINIYSPRSIKKLAANQNFLVEQIVPISYQGKLWDDIEQVVKGWGKYLLKSVFNQIPPPKLLFSDHMLVILKSK